MRRRFPRPWQIVELESAFKITDAEGFAVAYVYFTLQPSYSSHLMQKEDARVIASNIAKLGAEP